LSAFTDVRAMLAADLAAIGVTIHPSWPTSIDPPCVFIVPSLTSQYIADGPTFREVTVSVDVVVMVEHDAVEAALAALDQLLEAVLVNSMDWTLGGVDPPAPTTVTDSGAEYLAAVVHLSRPVHI
jgi:hypothetical protein